MRLLDLSHTIEHQMTTYPGLPGPEIGEHLGFDASAAHYSPGTEFVIGRISMAARGRLDQACGPATYLTKPYGIPVGPDVSTRVGRQPGRH